MPKHNRAPWRVKPVKGQAPYIVDADGLTIGMAMHWTGSENNPLPNAHMFAAAPDLLAACEEALEALIRTYGSAATVQEIREDLASGQMEKRLNWIGAERFDPKGRVRAMLHLQAAIARAKGEGDGH